jgi:serine/threonine-protein kinase
VSDQDEQLRALTTALADRYRIERSLGQGGMATVYLARDLRHERNVALKVLKPELPQALSAQRFLKEIHVTANLQHPHILPLYDSGSIEGALFYVMPLMTGESLRDRRARGQAFGHRRGAHQSRSPAHWTSRIARVCSIATSPENILLQDGEALLADFGMPSRAVCPKRA